MDALGGLPPRDGVHSAETRGLKSFTWVQHGKEALAVLVQVFVLGHMGLCTALEDSRREGEVGDCTTWFDGLARTHA